jgi:hypothetical protein
MAETQDASTGYMGEAWIHNGTSLVELVQVTRITLPDEEIEQVDKTHLKSPNRRREYMDGLIAGSEVEIGLNYRPLSDTDVLIRAAKAARDSRAVKLVIPENGVAVAQATFNGTVLGYNRGEITADGKMDATVRIRVDTAETFAAVS